MEQGILPEDTDVEAVTFEGTQTANPSVSNYLEGSTSSDLSREDVPLYRPLLVDALLMLDNRLPDGTACTMFTEPSDEHGHLVFDDGPFASALTEQVWTLADQVRASVADAVTFAYVQGPRSKTSAENRVWPRLGAQVNSMTLAPEVILANELEIPCAGLVVGHKYSIPDRDPPEQEALSSTLDRSREKQERLVSAFLREGEPVEFPNSIYRFGSGS